VAPSVVLASAYNLSTDDAVDLDANGRSSNQTAYRLVVFDHHASNGAAEAINGRLEALRRNALGFRNLTEYRIRSVLA
jgi:transposase